MILAPIWLPATLLAALLQTWRTAMQQKLRGQLSVNGAGVVRYLYGVPVGFALLLIHWALFGGAIPSMNARFIAFCIAGGLAQIIGTNMLIMSFSYRGFAVGTAYAKTEAVQGAILALIFLHEELPPMAWVGILIGFCGVMWLSLQGKRLTPGELLRATLQPGALCGLAAGFGFAMTAVLIKSANESLLSISPVRSALLTLAVTNLLQTLMQGSWLAWKEPQQFRAVFASWRNAFPVGALSACGSACWFTGFATAPVALVRMVGQVEIIFTLLFSHFYLKERPKPTEIAGALVVVFGVLVVVIGR